MKRDIAQRWVAALRSGEFSQTQGYLNIEGGYCCLGVLCELAVEDGVISKWGDHGTTTYGTTDHNSDVSLPRPVLTWAGMKGESLPTPVEVPFYDEDFGDDALQQYDGFAGLNDDAGFSFKQIAAVIDEQWERI